jgi:nucleoside-diphosphate-sugar epimerase
LITGASGFVGGHLAHRLARTNCRVRILARAHSDLSALYDITYERVEGDLSDPVSLIQAVDSVDYIYHVGGLIRAPNDETFIAVNGEGTKNLCAAAKSHAPSLKRFLYVSSLAASGPGLEGRLIDEEMPTRPITPYGASKRLGEQWLQTFDLAWTIVRPPAVYGPRDRGMLPLFRMAAHHVRPTLGHNGLTSVIFVGNLVDGIVRAAERPEGVGQVFLITDEQPYHRRDLARMIQAAVDTWAIPVHFPAWTVRLAARLSEAAAAGFHRVPFFNRHKANELLARNWACSIDKARLLLDYEPRIATPDGLRHTARSYRDEGWI